MEDSLSVAARFFLLFRCQTLHFIDVDLLEADRRQVQGRIAALRRRARHDFAREGEQQFWYFDQNDRLVVFNRHVAQNNQRTVSKVNDEADFLLAFFLGFNAEVGIGGPMLRTGISYKF